MDYSPIPMAQTMLQPCTPVVSLPIASLSHQNR
ncbi:hypothetical protein ISN45_At05g053070 [Arabidopsis thaliana x Arabidopsis arenosa]|uniref:Uncharacterized protein n=2 Tax=Arabidopsis TaxID=3701 RepID=A0A8T2E0T1_ARASU|nr:hypothetical protein ISN45_At05g053070 [Arabidopsis thaliana x Arabidopsis arenosa]KAG7613301.1 hypothetical protein ISN44_As05g052330 [Arabidopsis suecica]